MHKTPDLCKIFYTLGRICAILLYFLGMQKTKLLLIDSARKVFARIGVQHATMNDIAEESGKGRRTLYTYFKSKEDVYNAVVEQELDTLISKLESVMNSALTPDQKIIDRKII